MKHAFAGVVAVSAIICSAGCETVYPRKANVDAMNALRVEFEDTKDLADLRAAVTENEAALVRVATESRADAASAGPTKTGEQLDSNLLASEAAYFLLRLAPEQRNAAGMVEALGASVAAFAESVSSEAVGVCNQDSGPGGEKARSCWEADVLFDAIRTAPLVDYMRGMAGGDVAAMTGDDWRTMTNAMAELEVLFEEEWTAGLTALDTTSEGAMSPQVEERVKFFMPYLCYADEALVTIATQGGALQTEEQRRQMMAFDAAGTRAVAQGASLPNFSPKPEVLATCANDESRGEATCRTRAHWSEVSRKCGAIRTCIAQSGDQSGCISQQFAATPGS